MRRTRSGGFAAAAHRSDHNRRGRGIRNFGSQTRLAMSRSREPMVARSNRDPSAHLCHEGGMSAHSHGGADARMHARVTTLRSPYCPAVCVELWRYDFVGVAWTAFSLRNFVDEVNAAARDLRLVPSARAIQSNNESADVGSNDLNQFQRAFFRVRWILRRPAR